MFKRVKTRVILYHVALGVLPLLIAGTVIVHGALNTYMREGLLYDYNHNVEMEVDRIESMLAEAKTELFVLRDFPVLHNVLSSHGDEYEKQKVHLEHAFQTVSQARKHYYQIRYLDETGMEVVRVDFDGKKAFVVPEPELQSKADRYYFQDSIMLNHGELYASSLDLNRERGEVERPYKPVIRYATPVFDNQKKRGVLVINLLANSFLEPLDSMNTVDDSYYLSSGKGFFFVHPDPGKTWGGPDDLNTGWSADNEFQEFKEVEPGIIRVGIENFERGEYLTAHATIYPDDADKDIFWKLVRMTKKETVFAPLYRMYSFLIATLILTAVIAAAAAVLLTKRIVCSYYTNEGCLKEPG